MADARDGHGSVVDTRSTEGRAMLPVRLGVMEGQLVVTATSAPAEVPVGAVVSSVDGVPAARRLADAMRLASGTTQWKQSRALQEIATCPPGAAVKLTIDTGTGSQARSLTCEAKQQPAEKRPEVVTELAPGIWYVDVTRVRMIQFAAVIDKLAVAKGVVFDVRGYPTDAGAQYFRSCSVRRKPTAGCTSTGSSARSVNPRDGELRLEPPAAEPARWREDHVPHRRPGHQLCRVRDGVSGGP